MSAFEVISINLLKVGIVIASISFVYIVVRDHYFIQGGRLKSILQYNKGEIKINSQSILKLETKYIGVNLYGKDMNLVKILFIVDGEEFEKQEFEEDYSDSYPLLRFNKYWHYDIKKAVIKYEKERDKEEEELKKKKRKSKINDLEKKKKKYLSIK